jgi:tight adherence protein B
MFYILIASVFICVSGLIFAASMLLKGDNEQINERLESLTKNKGRGAAKVSDEPASLLKSPLDDVPNQIEQFVSRFLNLSAFIEQSGVNISVSQFVGATIGLGTVASFAYMATSPVKSLTPLVFLLAAALPFGFVWFKRRSRMKKFNAQLPEALDLICQALRAGQSMPAGIQLVGQQMDEPIGPEFHRAFEQQNLGISLEDSLKMMLERIPNLDLQFFVTSVILQRTTGGDLAEILDKIGRLIRERFQIWGQIQALTGEGRLSGIVLLALPPSLMLVMFRLNYDYIMMLFEDPFGQKMLIFGIIMQILGAIAIKKIITIKV